MSPEAISKRIYSKSSDVWSFGVTVWEILERQNPYPDLTGTQLVMKIAKEGTVNLPTVENYPDLDAIIKMCMEFEPSKRPSFQQLLKEIPEK